MLNKPAKTKKLLAVYGVILAGIIFIADKKGTEYLLDFYGNIPYGDKIGHFILAGGLLFLLNLVLRVKKNQFAKTDFLAGSFTAAIIFAAEEFSQIFIKDRSFEITDLLTNFAGILTFGKIADLIFKFSRKEEIG